MMNKIVTLILLLTLFLSDVILNGMAFADSTSKKGGTAKRVAMLISGHGNVDETLSYDLEELVQSYLIFHRNQIDIDIVTPNGGPVPVKSNKDDVPYVSTFKKDTNALAMLANTLSAEQASQRHYDALFIVGGDGAVFDLPFDQNTQKWITTFAHGGKPIAAVCHGPAALVDVKMHDGSYFVANKLVNSFTFVEDHAFKKENIEKYPLITQTELEKRGARFVANRPMLPFVAIDENLITAQNPTSVAKAAETLLLAMGIQPVARQAYKDEASMELIAKARNMGVSHIDFAMLHTPERYDMMYLALYGLYAFPLAETEQDKTIELQIMEKIGEYFKHPQYATHMINTFLNAGDREKAKFHFELAKQQFTDFSLPEAISNKL
ncbi:type 1 glutamine amidotransferase domain-containing protein [Alteromonas sediminis]|uniref:Glutamine amidotransferase-like class 1 domain-containing protein 1 n=1 Tax=Alteromonas sediminis TaxID=2259342 RepID=A0A3N5Y057_9ALTE|nr:type 1 glutamine amidotransferase domain-containing protein [Alteromonas sediminis]RPJ66987.1 type 1 glutamine amidotransferase domain-containing protein [Alteromonas sediminis]